MKHLSLAIQMKPTEQHFLLVLFITLNKLVLALESMDEV